MLILACESSCDDTSWALVRDGKEVVSLGLFSQTEIHTKTGGVVPEVAAREHVEQVIPVLQKALETLGEETIDMIAVTQGPGLVGSLLVGLETAKTLAIFWNKPLIPVHHIEGHIYANWLERDAEDIKMPAVILTVSGGHNDVYLMDKIGKFVLLGSTLDDAAGEAFDKVARMIGLGYPGGPAIERIVQASGGNLTDAHPLPRAWVSGTNNFSFSGLKSEVRRQVDAKGSLTENDQRDLAYSFQESVVEVLGKKTFNAAREQNAVSICVTGGVSASSRLREWMELNANKYGYDSSQVFFPKKKLYSTDNAAMIGAAGYLIAKHSPGRVLHDVEAIQNLAPLLSYVLV